MRSQLIDNYGRPITYVRLSVTDLCNLRCVYCMPAEGVPLAPRREILALEELKRLVSLLAAMGITKVRITGGEPLVRRGVLDVLRHIRTTPGIESLYITTNGVLTTTYLDELSRIGISGINLSLDTLNRDRFARITRRDCFDQVLQSVEALVARQIPLKINTVVLNGCNTEDIIPLSQLSERYPVDIRFIEEMPFNGRQNPQFTLQWNAARIIQVLRAAYPEIQRMPDTPHATACYYRIPGHRGRVGVIAGFTHTFCGDCNRIRITTQGMLKTCLYDDGVLNLKQFLRDGSTDMEIQAAIRKCVGQRMKDGRATQTARRQQVISESMSLIGG